MTKTLLAPLVLIPSMLNIIHHNPSKYWIDNEIGYGRGVVNPPTIEDLKEIKCLATMVYGEARGETKEGKVAVAYTAVNRAVNKTVCGVVLAPNQYSIFNDNPALRLAATSLKVDPRQQNILEKAAWKESFEVAHQVIAKNVPDPTNGGTHYIAPKVMKEKGYIYPAWTRQFQLVAVIDNHKFYRQKVKA